MPRTAVCRWICRLLMLTAAASTFAPTRAAASETIEWAEAVNAERRGAGFVATADDPQLLSRPLAQPVPARQSYLLIEARSDAPTRLECYWMGPGQELASERTATLDFPATSSPVVRVLDLNVNGGFAGAERLRLDFSDKAGITFEPRRVALVGLEQVPAECLPGLIDLRCFTSRLHYLPGERIEYRATLRARCYPDRDSSKLLRLALFDPHGTTVTTAFQQYGLLPGQTIKEVQGVLDVPAALAPGRYRLAAESLDQRDGLRLAAEHVFGVRAESDPVVIETPFKFVKDFSLVRDAGGLWHLFSITGDFAANHDWVLSGQERTFSHATSSDLRHWQMHPPVLSISDRTYPDGRERYQDRNVWAPHVVRHGDTYYMFYTSVNRHVSQSISLATSQDLFHWTPYEHNPVFTPEGIEWADWGRDRWGDCRDPMVLREGDKWYLYVTARAKSPEATGKDHGIVIVAESDDLLHWGNPRIAARGEVICESPQVWKHGGRFYMTTSSIGRGTWVSDHPARGWRRVDFPLPDIAALERHVTTSPGYAEEVVADGAGGQLMAVLTWRHWGNSIYLFRIRYDGEGIAGYDPPR